MTVLFWLLAIGLTLLALAFLLLPPRRRLAAAMPDDTVAVAVPVPSHRMGRWTMLGVMSVIPAATLGLYLYLGAPAIIEAQQLLDAHGKRDVNAMLVALETGLKTNPDDAEGWHVLGQSFLALQRIEEAEMALAKAMQLAPKEARYMSQYAEVLALRANGKLEGRPLELINAALELDYQDDKALELAGLAAYQREEWAQAAHFWRRLLTRLPVESDFHQGIKAALADAENRSAQASGLGDRAKLQTEPKKSNPHF
jgi:cytochrome c-type biogenesis protein CcmH